MMEKNGMHCGRGMIKMGVVITAFGSIFLLGNLNVITSETVSILWPLLLVLIGVVKIVKGATCAGSRDTEEKK